MAKTTKTKKPQPKPAKGTTKAAAAKVLNPNPFARKKPSRKRGRPNKGEVNICEVIRSVVLKNPSLAANPSAIKDIVTGEIPDEFKNFSPPLVNQAIRNLSSFFLTQASRIGLNIDRLIEFLRICKQFPCEQVAANLETRYFKNKPVISKTKN
jgi:hypothetical protein